MADYEYQVIVLRELSHVSWYTLQRRRWLLGLFPLKWRKVYPIMQHSYDAAIALKGVE